MIEKDWFASWFDTPYYHQLYSNRNEEEAKLFISNLLNFLELKPSSKLLDLACGKGRHSKTLNEFGFNVLGVDLSPKSIDTALQMSNENLSFKVHDMRKVIEGHSFDAIFNLFTSFGYFDSSVENDSVCSAIAQVLKPKGKLVIDFMNAKKVISNLISNETKKVDEITFQLKRNFDGQHIFKHIHFEDNGQSFYFTERVQAIMLNDFEKLLNRDFTILHTFGSFDLKPFDENNSDRLIIVAERK